MFHEVRINSYSIDSIFGEDSGTFSQPEIIGLVQSFLKYQTSLQYPAILKVNKNNKNQNPTRNTAS